MAAEYFVVDAKNAGERDNPHGGKLTKWYLTLRNEGGIEKGDVYAQTKPGNLFERGQSVYGRVEQGQYGPRFFREQRPDGSAPRSGGGGGSSNGGDHSASIEAQVALKVAGEIIASGKGTPADLSALTVAAYRAIQDAKGDGPPPPQPMADSSDVPADTSGLDDPPPPDDSDVPF